MIRTDLPDKALLADELLPEGLQAFLAERRNQARPLSYDRIARDLWVATNQRVEATGPTVQGWWERLEAAAAEASA